MQPTKYPVQADSARSGAIPEGAARHDMGGDSCPARDRRDRSGRGAPLDLIEGHLTDIASPCQYRRASAAGRLLENWFVPEHFNGPAPGELRYVLKVQPFAQGGYEATCRPLDLEKISRAMEPHRRHGKREAPEELDAENVARAAARARRKVRQLVRNMKADHLVTFTRRESDPLKFWSEEQWSAAWDRACRLMKRIIGSFPYVAILERHQKGNFHLHVAWCGKVNVKVVRRCWEAAAGGRGACNIDAKHIKAPHGHDRASRIARYISKYVTKSFLDNPRFNKKRYWASRQTLEEARRYVLNALHLSGALDEVQAFLGLDWTKFAEMGRGGNLVLRNVFKFPDEGGVWINYLPDIHGGDPPF